MSDSNNKVVIVWSSADRDVALSMVMMYTLRSKQRGLWEEVTFIVWGPSARLLAQDVELQEYVREMMREGIVVEACLTCADMHGVTEELRQLDIDVKPMGVPLTEYLKEGRHVLTF